MLSLVQLVVIQLARQQACDSGNTCAVRHSKMSRARCCCWLRLVFLRDLPAAWRATYQQRA